MRVGGAALGGWWRGAGKRGAGRRSQAACRGGCAFRDGCVFWSDARPGAAVRVGGSAGMRVLGRLRVWVCVGEGGAAVVCEGVRRGRGAAVVVCWRRGCGGGCVPARVPGGVLPGAVCRVV